MQRSVILNGFMASGKSTTARALAVISGATLVDLDQLIVARAGKPIVEIFAQDGESTFRDLERTLLLETLTRTPGVVISVGGGALVERDMRLKAMQSAVVVTLSAGWEETLRRLGSDGGDRPLGSGVKERDLRRTFDARELAYAEAHEVVDVAGREARHVAQEIYEIWRRDPVGVAAGDRSYSVEVGSGIAPERVGPQLKGASMSLLITDETVDDLYGQAMRSAIDAAGVRHETFRMVPGEEHKTPSTLQAIWDVALEAQADRSSCFVGLGGGVATDVAGFVSATWMRGVEWVSVPTTLLGMVDASVGGKTAVDLPNAKNCVGAFWQPKRVVCDVAYLRTECQRRFSSGMAEVVKTALLGDAELFDMLEREHVAIMRREEPLIEDIVRRCVATKARIVSEDARESGLRAALNLGHTVGHALEAVGGYGNLMHGEAVSLGLVAAMKIGESLGVQDGDVGARTTELLNRLGLPTDLSSQPLEAASKLLANDKKRGGGAVRFVFSPAPGSIVFKKLPLEELEELTCGLG